jgi:hypothetical protein
MHRTQWAAQFAAASELCKRGFEVSLTMGNRTPLADLMVVSPRKNEMFLVDVKGLYRKNPWVVKQKEIRKNLFYIFVFVPNDTSNRFFILPQQRVNRLIRSELRRLNRPTSYPMTGITWNLALPFENAWDTLPQ